MATRLLLAFIALLTGLASQAAPAQARDCGGRGMEIEAATATSGAALRRGVAVLTVAVSAPRAAIAGTSDTPLPMSVAPWRVKSVHIGVDRARE